MQRCGQCGADELTFDPGSQGLACPYCQHKQPLQLAGPQPVEHSLRVALSQQLDAASQGYGLQVRSLECDNCGARVNFTGKEVSKRCDFCDSPHVLEKEAHASVIPPNRWCLSVLKNNAPRTSSRVGWRGCGFALPT